MKKQERADRLAVAKKRKEDEEAVEAQRKVEEAAKKKGSEQPLVSFSCLSSLVVQKLTQFPVWAGCSA